MNKQFLKIGSVFLTGLMLSLPVRAAATDRVFVKRAVDGDTLLLRSGERVRLIGVDTPESVRPNTPVQYFAKEASHFTKEKVEGKFVNLEYGEERRDKYDRVLAYVYMEDGTLLNAELIKQGYGFAYTRFPFKYMDEFRQYERDARLQGKGLWGRFSPKGDGKYDVIWIGSKQTKVFHRPDCHYGIAIPDADLVKFRSKYAPVDQGFTPCKTCIKKGMI